jgi:hypothetical protein
MIIIRQLRLVCPHLIHDRLEPRKHGIDRLSSQLRKVLVLISVHLKELGLNLGSPLMIPFKGLLDLSSHMEVTNMIKLRVQKARKDSNTGLAICIMLVNLLLTNSSSKHLII